MCGLHSWWISLSCCQRLVMRVKLLPHFTHWDGPSHVLRLQPFLKTVTAYQPDASILESYGDMDFSFNHAAGKDLVTSLHFTNFNVEFYFSFFFFYEWLCITVETLYSTIYYSQNFIELNIDKSTQYVALWTHKRHPIPRPFGRAMECLLWVLQQKLIVL